MPSICGTIKTFFLVLWIVVSNIYHTSAKSPASYSDITFFIYEFSRSDAHTVRSAYVPIETLLSGNVGGFAFYLKYDTNIDELVYNNGSYNIRFTKTLLTIKNYLDENPEEILTLFFFTDTSAQSIQYLLKNTKLNDRAYYFNGKKPWPSLEHLQSINKQLVIFINEDDSRALTEPMHSLWEYVAEYSYPTEQFNEALDHAAEYNLLLTRGYDSFLGSSKPPSVNDNPLIMNHYMDIWRNAGRIPNFVFFDDRMVNQIGAVRIILSDMDRISGKIMKDSNLLGKVYWLSPANSITGGGFTFPNLGKIREIIPSSPGYHFAPASMEIQGNRNLKNVTFRAIPLDITNDMAAFYRLNGNARDGSSNKNHGIIHGATFKFDATRGQVAYFNGKGIITLPGAEKMKIRNSSFTVAVWINVEEFTKSDHSVIGTENVVYRKGLHLILRDKIPYFGFFANDLKGQTVIEEGKWYHVVWRYNRINGEQAIFVNGREDGRSYNHPSFAGEEELVISKSILRDSYFIGMMDDIGIWNRPLGKHEINNLYTGNLNPAKELNTKRLIRYLFYMLLLIIVAVIILYWQKLMVTGKYLFFSSHKRGDTVNDLAKPVQFKNAIFLFGKFEIFDIHGNEFSNRFSDKVLQMFLVLLSNNIMGKTGISSEELEKVLWPELIRKKASNNRRVNMLKLRKLIENLDGIEIILTKKLWVLELSNPVYCDLFEYLKLAEKKKLNQLSYFQHILPIIKRGEFLKGNDFRELEDFKASVSYEIVDVLEMYLQEFAESITSGEIIEITDRILIIDDLNQMAIWYKTRTLIQKNNNKLARHIFECFVRKYTEVYGESFHCDYSTFTSEKFIDSG